MSSRYRIPELEVPPPLRIKIDSASNNSECGVRIQTWVRLMAEPLCLRLLRLLIWKTGDSDEGDIKLGNSWSFRL